MTTRVKARQIRAGSASPFRAFIATLNYLSNAEGRINSDPNNYDAYYQDEQYTLVAARRGRHRIGALAGVVGRDGGGEARRRGGDACFY